MIRFIKTSLLFLLIACLFSCKKLATGEGTPHVDSPKVEQVYFKDLDLMAARTGFYISDSISLNGSPLGAIITQNFEFRHFVPEGKNLPNMFLGNSVSGSYYLKNNGAFAPFTKISRAPLRLVSTTAEYINKNVERSQIELPMKGYSDMDNLVRRYLQGAQPSSYSSSIFFSYPFSQFNQLRLLFADDVNIPELIGIKKETVAKGEPLVFYSEREAFRLKLYTELKHYLTGKYNEGELKDDEVGYIQSVIYGKIALMVFNDVESRQTVRQLVTKISNKGILTLQEKKFLDQTQIFFYFRGYSSEDVNRVHAENTTTEKVTRFLETTGERPLLFPEANKYTYESCGEPIFLIVKELTEEKTFLNGHKFNKSIKF